MPQNVAALPLSRSLSVSLSVLQVNYICCIRATSVDCVGACTFCGTGCCSFSAILLLCCFVAFYLNATAEQREGETGRGTESTQDHLFWFSCTHTHTHIQPATTVRFAFISQTMRCQNIVFTRINDMQHCLCLCVYLCVWHILNASIAISILIMNISVVRCVAEGEGEATSSWFAFIYEPCTGFLTNLSLWQAATCSLQHCSLAASGNGSSSCKWIEVKPKMLLLLPAMPTIPLLETRWKFSFICSGFWLQAKVFSS